MAPCFRAAESGLCQKAAGAARARVRTVTATRDPYVCAPRTHFRLDVAVHDAHVVAVRDDRDHGVERTRRGLLAVVPHLHDAVKQLSA